MVNTLHMIRQMMPDPKDISNNACAFDDDYYEVLCKRHSVNPNAPASETSKDKYRAITLDAWYDLAGDMAKLRKMEEIGVITGDFDAAAHIRMLEFQLSNFRGDVYGEVTLP